MRIEYPMTLQNHRFARCVIRRLAALWVCLAASAAGAAPQTQCAKPVYLTFDTGHMAVAPLIAEVLKRQHVRVTFFVADEPTKEGDGSLGEHWAAWWRERAAEGHVFGSHTYDHVYWQADLPPGPGESAPRFRMRPSAGSGAGKSSDWSAAQYCANIDRAASRLYAITGKKLLPLYRAPGGKTSPKLIDAARQCGWEYVGWSPAGFLGDELPSEAYPNKVLLERALQNIRPGDVLLAHLGIWSRKDAWAPAVLEPLIAGLKEKGYCFATLDQYPQYRSWIEQHPLKP